MLINALKSVFHISARVQLTVMKSNHHQKAWVKQLPWFSRSRSL